LPAFNGRFRIAPFRSRCRFSAGFDSKSHTIAKSYTASNKLITRPLAPPCRSQVLGQEYYSVVHQFSTSPLFFPSLASFRLVAMWNRAVFIFSILSLLHLFVLSVRLELLSGEFVKISKTRAPYLI
jgi:hypothetical protein